MHLRMRAAVALVETLADDGAVMNDDCANHRIRGNGATTLLGKLERVGHECLVAIHQHAYYSRLARLARPLHP